MVGLGKLGQYCEPLGYCSFDSTAVAVSSDGSIIVGTTSTPNDHSAPYRWTEPLGMIELPIDVWSVVDVSGDGQMIVGELDQYLVYRYSAAEGLLIIDAAGVGSSGNAGVEAISDNGTTIVGLVYFTPSAPTGFEAYRWTEEEGFELLGVLGPPGDAYSLAHAASADGSVIVGSAGAVDRVFQGFVWTSEMGIQSLEDFLTQDHGLDLTGWEIWRAVDVSADGQTILGYGVNPDGHGEAWIATLSAAPVPALSPLGVGFLAALLLLLAGSRSLMRARRSLAPGTLRASPPSRG
jgi:uncharacterized membrane protein